MKNRVLVIGGTRFVGVAVVRRLVEEGHDVTVLHRGITEAPLPRAVRHRHGDRSSPATLGSAVTASEPDVVLDMVAYTEREAEQAAEALAGRVPRVVVVSSLDVYQAYGRFAGLEAGSPGQVPIDEQAPLRSTRYPRRSRASGTGDWRYDYDKVLVEQAYRANSQLAVTCLRLPFVYGLDDFRNRVGQLLGRMKTNGSIDLSSSEASWRATRGYVENIAAAVTLTLTDARAVDRDYNLGDAVSLTTVDWVNAVARAIGWRGTVTIRDPAAREPQVPWAHHLELDTNRIRRELGFDEPVALDEGLRRTVRS